MDLTSWWADLSKEKPIWRQPLIYHKQPKQQKWTYGRNIQKIQTHIHVWEESKNEYYNHNKTKRLLD